MTNYEKYREEIIEILTDCMAIVEGRPVLCKGTSCKDCDLWPATDCSIRKWINAEYVEVEPSKLTKAERAFCESLQPGCCIVRNVTGCLYVYTEKPVKSGMSWSLPGAKHTCCTSIGAIHNVSFPFIRWKDEQPWKVEDLLKLEVLDEKGED